MQNKVSWMWLVCVMGLTFVVGCSSSSTESNGVSKVKPRMKVAEKENGSLSYTTNTKKRERTSRRKNERSRVDGKDKKTEPNHVPSQNLKKDMEKLIRLRRGVSSDKLIAALARHSNKAVLEIENRTVDGSLSTAKAVRLLKAINTRKSQVLLRSFTSEDLGGSNPNDHYWAACILMQRDRIEAWRLLKSSSSARILAAALVALDGEPVNKRWKIKLFRKCFENEDGLVRGQMAIVMAKGCEGKRVRIALRYIIESLKNVGELPNLKEPSRIMLGAGSTIEDACYQNHLEALTLIKVKDRTLRYFAKKLEGRPRDVMYLALVRRSLARRKKKHPFHDEMIALIKNKKAGMFRVWAIRTLPGYKNVDDIPFLEELSKKDRYRTGSTYPVRDAAKLAIHAIKLSQANKAKSPPKKKEPDEEVEVIANPVDGDDRVPASP